MLVVSLTHHFLIVLFLFNDARNLSEWGKMTKARIWDRTFEYTSSSKPISNWSTLSSWPSWHIWLWLHTYKLGDLHSSWAHSKTPTVLRKNQRLLGCLVYMMQTQPSTSESWHIRHNVALLNVFPYGLSRISVGYTPMKLWACNVQNSWGDRGVHNDPWFCLGWIDSLLHLQFRDSSETLFFAVSVVSTAFSHNS